MNRDYFRRTNIPTQTVIFRTEPENIRKNRQRKVVPLEQKDIASYEVMEPVINPRLLTLVYVPSLTFSLSAGITFTAVLLTGCYFLDAASSVNYTNLVVESGLSKLFFTIITGIFFTYYFRERQEVFDGLAWREEKFKTHTRLPDPALFVPKITPAEQEKEEATEQARSLLRVPGENTLALAKFAAAILQGKANFSHQGSFRKKGARDFGYSREQFKKLRLFFVANNYAEAVNKGKHNESAKLLPVAYRQFEVWAKEKGTLPQNWKPNG